MATMTSSPRSARRAARCTSPRGIARPRCSAARRPRATSPRSRGTSTRAWTPTWPTTTNAARCTSPPPKARSRSAARCSNEARTRSRPTAGATPPRTKPTPSGTRARSTTSSKPPRRPAPSRTASSSGPSDGLIPEVAAAPRRRRHSSGRRRRRPPRSPRPPRRRRTVPQGVQKTPRLSWRSASSSRGHITPPVDIYRATASTDDDLACTDFARRLSSRIPTAEREPLTARNADHFRTRSAA
mmetsp:Transcript_2071/g.8012  ORF Transcript_2071/g.8012 Transcript_2071/m.8012 type:complete len:242 (-) Transcript_2071:1119-1844(-)